MASATHRAQPHEAGRIDLIVQALTQRSRTQVRGLFDNGCVSLNGQICTDAGAHIKAADEIRVDYDASRNYKERPKMARSPIFQLVFEDDCLLIVDKMAGYLTEPNHPRDENTLSGALARYLSKGPSKRRKAYTVHRLDRDTSGLLVFAKSEAVAQKIKTQFEARKPLREYVAIVVGHLKKSEGTFRSHLMTDDDLNQRSTLDTHQGKLAVTHYKTLEVLKDATLVSVTLETGRRNQIRVHFAESGHPVIGDVRYEKHAAAHPHWKWQRLALHAAQLGIKHPETGKEMAFRSEIPEEFVTFARSGRSR